MTSIGDIVGNCFNLGNGCFFLFDSHSKNSSGNICQNGTSVLLKFQTLSKLQEYVKDIYYVGLKHETLYFQIQFINLLSSSEEMKVIKSRVALERQEILNLPEVSAIDETEGDSLIVENESFESVDDPLNAHRTAGYETTFVPEIPRIIEDDNVIMAPGQGKTPISLLNHDDCEELAFPYLFPTGKFSYKVKLEMPLSSVKYFNLRLLNFRKSFASDADYIFFARSIVAQYHLTSYQYFSAQSTRHAIKFRVGNAKL